MPLDCIQCQSVLTKNLGPFSTWKERLQVAKESGYNMIHFTPLQVIPDICYTCMNFLRLTSWDPTLIFILSFDIQQLGDSDSCYSLASHQRIDSRYDTSWDDVQRLTEYMNNTWNILSISDIVLNHTANESPWIQDHPECTYNCFNTPNLRPAFLLDQMFLKLTKGNMA